MIQNDFVTWPRFAIPDLPACFVPRPVEQTLLRDAILYAAPGLIVVTGATREPGLPSAYGVGKSTLVAAVAHDVLVRTVNYTVQAFADGVFWLTLGERPPLTLLQAQLAQCLSGHPHLFADAQAGNARLTELLADRACLLVLDDVRRLEDLDAFAALGPRGCLVITTEDTGRIAELGAQEVRLSALNDIDAAALLAGHAGLPVDALPSAAAELARLCGHLPLPLALTGSLLHGRPDAWDTALGNLRAPDLQKLGRQFPHDPYPFLLGVVETAVDDLPAALRARYIDLAVFPPQALISQEVLRVWWMAERATHIEVDEALSELERRTLVFSPEAGMWSLHPLLHSYVRKRVGSWPALHQRLLAACQSVWGAAVPLRKGMSVWSTLPREADYLWHHLAEHLVEARQEDELGRLLSDVNWLQGKLNVAGLAALLDDFALLPNDQVLRQVRDALIASSDVLLRDPAQLAGQLCGRLLSSRLPQVRDMLQDVTRWKGIPWLRPLLASLTPPGGSLELHLAGHRRGVRAVDVSPDGQQAVSGAEDGQLIVWDLAQGFQIHAWPGHQDVVNDVAFLPDGQRVISASADGTLKVWNLGGEFNRGGELNRRGSLEAVLRGHIYAVNSVTVLPDGQQVVSASADGTLKVWNLAERGGGQELGPSRTLAGHGGPAWAAAALPDGRHVLSGGADGTLRLWDLDRGTERQVFSGNVEVYAVTVTPDGERAIFSGADGAIRVWDMSRGRLLHTLKGHAGPVHALAVTADGLWCISASADGALTIWDMERGTKRSELTAQGGVVWDVAAAWDGRAVSALADGTLKVWNLEPELHTLTGHRGAVNAVAILPDGKSVFSASDDRTLKLWSLFWRRSVQRVFKGHSHDVNAIALFADGRLALSASRDRTLKVWSLLLEAEPRTTEALLTLSGHNAPVKTVAVWPGGRQAISGSSDKTLKVWDIAGVLDGDPARCSEVCTLSGHAGRVTSVAVLNATQAISAAEDGTLKVWDVPQQSEAFTLFAHESPVWAVAAATGGRWAVSGASDGTLKVWDLTQRTWVRTLIGHEGQVTAVALLPDGRRAISCAVDHTLRVWDLADGRTVACFTGESPMLSCAVGPDQQTMAAGDKAGRVHLLFMTG